MRNDDERASVGLDRRGQMNLPALAVALLLVTTVTVMSFGMADRAYLSSERDADQRRIAVAVSERLVGVETPVTARENVLDADAVENLSASRLRALFPTTEGTDVRVRLGNRTVVEAGDPTDGTTIRRVVLVEHRESVALTPELSANDPTVTLPRRSPRVDIELTPPDGTNVTVVRANENVVLKNNSRLFGNFEVSLSRFETTTLIFEADGPLPTGSVEVTYYPAETRKAVLAVTVDG
jgi:putative heme iron utilization protein